MVNLVLIIAVICCGVSVSEAFFFSNKIDCMVTTWSTWSEPNEFGQRIRRSKILRLSSNGGRPCPHILEVKDEKGRNSTSWSGWSGLFGFEQISRHREWVDSPIVSPNNAGAKMSIFKPFGLIDLFEEDIRYIGVKPGLTETSESFTHIFVDGYPDISNRIGFVRDIVLILDSSGSIGETRFTQAKKDLRKLFSLLCPDEGTFDGSSNNKYGHQQLAMITYSTTVDENFFFNTYSRTENVLDAILNARYHGGLTNTAEAFRKAQDMFRASRGARNYPLKVKNEVFIVTDGRSNIGGNACHASQVLSKVADVYGLMIGTFTAAGMEELTCYVSKPASQHLFSLENFEFLSKLVEYVQAYKIINPQKCAPFNTSSENNLS